jgi:catechol 2,3-dioxygenase-like lactoylglutathione lyase family enzyme
MAKLAYVASVIFVKDIAKSKRFYTQVLDCEIEHDFGKNVIFYGGLSIWQISDSHTIEQKAKPLGTSNRFELYFETEAIQQLFNRLQKEKVVFLHELQTENWGQITFRFFDPDNHMIEIGESLPTFIRRIYKQCGSLEKTMQITGIPISTIQDYIS